MSNGTIPVTQYGIGDTTQVGGSRFAFADPIGLNPPGYGPIIANSSFAVPSVPPTYGDQTATMTGTVDGEPGTAGLAAQYPFSLDKSPLLWVALALIGGLFAIHHVHWKGE